MAPAVRALVVVCLSAAGAFFVLHGEGGAGERPDSTRPASPSAPVMQPTVAAAGDIVALSAPVAPPEEPAAAGAVSPAPELNPGLPRLIDTQLIGNCSGPPSPGEYVRITSSADYRVGDPTQVVGAVRLATAAGRDPLATETRRWWMVSGDGRLEWTDIVRLPDSRGFDIVASTWMSARGSVPLFSAPQELEVPGATLLVRTVDTEGRAVPAAVSVDSAGCLRTRGATLEAADGERAAFYHLNPFRSAEILVTADGYRSAGLSLFPWRDGLQAGTVQEVTVTIEPLLEEAVLRQQLTDLVGAWAGWNAVSVTDLQSGRTVSLNGDRHQLAGCTIKIFLLMAVAQDIEAGKYTAGSVDELVRRAMGPSQVWPAYKLFEIIGDGYVGTGVRRVNDIMWGLGMTRSIITHPPGYYWEEYGYAESRGISENYLTTNDLNLALGKLFRGEALSPWATEYVLWSMTLAPGFLSGSLGGPLPYGVQIYHKMGQLDSYDGTWNDAGIVVFERDGQKRAYAISYLGSFSRWRNHYNYGYQASAAAWQAFSQAYLE